MDMLIAEDLLLLLLDDDRGTTPNLWVDARTPLAAAVLAELAIDGAVELEPGSGLRSAKLRATGQQEADPVLAGGLAVVAEKPRTPSSLAERVGKGLRDQLADRLADRGVLERREERVLGLFPRTTWPAASTEHEQQVRERLRLVLLQDAEPDAREAALIGILGALDQAARVIGARGSEASHARKRAKAIAKGDWASKAVSDAVQTMLVAVMTPVIVTTAATSS